MVMKCHIILLSFMTVSLTISLPEFLAILVLNATACCNICAFDRVSLYVCNLNKNFCIQSFVEEGHPVQSHYLLCEMRRKQHEVDNFTTIRKLLPTKSSFSQL